MGDLSVNFQKLIQYLKEDGTFKLNDKGDELDPSHLAEYAEGREEGCPEGTVFQDNFSDINGEEQAGFKDATLEYVDPQDNPGQYKFNEKLLDRESFINELYVDGANTLTVENLGKLYDIISTLDGNSEMSKDELKWFASLGNAVDKYDTIGNTINEIDVKEFFDLVELLAAAKEQDVVTETVDKPAETVYVTEFIEDDFFD